MRIIFYIIILLIAIATVWIPFQNSEIITIDWIGYHIEISSIIMVILLLLFILILSLFLHFVIFLKSLPISIKKYYQEKQEKSDLLLLLEVNEVLYSQNIDKIKNLVKIIDKSKEHQQIKSLNFTVSFIKQQCYEVLYKHNNEYEEDLENSYQELLHSEKHKLLSYKGLIEIRLARDRYNDALFYAEKAYAISPKNHWLINDLIKIYQELDLYDKLDVVIKKALDYKFIAKEEVDELLIENYVNHANFYIAELDVDCAISLLEKALKIDPAYPDAVLILTRLYSQTNKKRLAQKIIDKAWKKKPSEQLAYILLNIFQNETIIKKAKLLEGLINEAPEDESGYLVLAEFYIDEDMVSEARLVMDRLLSLHTPNYKISKVMALIETKTHNNYSIIENWLLKI
ncbi:MAG: tetratricopeptide repeat protein [Pseudomonadota bacterium]